MARVPSEHVALSLDLSDNKEVEPEFLYRLRPPFQKILQATREAKVEKRKVNKARRQWGKGHVNR